MLYEMLGNGAFGYVRRGKWTKNLHKKVNLVTSVVRHDVLLVIVYCRFILKLLQVHDLVDLLKWYYDQNFTP